MLFLVILTVLFSVGCSSTKVAETTIAPEPVLQEIKEIPAPVVKEVPVIKEETKAEPKPVEQPFVVKGEPKEEPEKVDFKYNYYFEYAGYRIDIEVHNGYGYVTYPTIISENDLMEAASAFIAARGDMGVTFAMAEPGKLNVRFPENLSKADLDYVANLAASYLVWYLDQKFAKVEEPVAEPTPVVELPVEVVKEEPKKVDFKYDYYFEYGGYRIDIEVHNGYGYVTYPTIISANDLMEAAATFTAAHGDMGVTFAVAESGKLNVKFPENLSKADLDYVANLASSDLIWYLDQKFAEVEEPVAEPTPVVELPVEVVKEEPAPVVEQPVVVVKEEVAPAVSQPVVEKSATPAPAAPAAPVAEEKGMSAFAVVMIVLVFAILAGACYYFIIYKKKD